MKNNYIPRRSFIQKATNALFALAGVKVSLSVRHLYAVNPPVGVPSNRDGAGCGNAGAECAAGCAARGAKSGEWVKCCSVNGTWQCCTYADYCAMTDTTEIEACRFRGIPFRNIGASQPQWCLQVPVYICTVTSCAGSFSDYAACAAGCSGNTMGGQKV